MRDEPHWATGRCWCAEFHGDQVETIFLVPPPVIAGRPQFDVAREVREQLEDI